MIIINSIPDLFQANAFLSALNILGIKYLRHREAGKIVLPDTVNVLIVPRIVRVTYFTDYALGASTFNDEQYYEDLLLELGYARAISGTFVITGNIDVDTYRSFSREMLVANREFLSTHPWRPDTTDPMRVMANMLVEGSYQIDVPPQGFHDRTAEIIYYYGTEYNRGIITVEKYNVERLHAALVSSGTSQSMGIAEAMEHSLLLPEEYWIHAIRRSHR